MGQVEDRSSLNESIASIHLAPVDESETKRIVPRTLARILIRKKGSRECILIFLLVLSRNFFLHLKILLKIKNFKIESLR